MSGETPGNAMERHTSTSGAPLVQTCDTAVGAAFQAELLAMMRAINRRLDELPARLAGVRNAAPSKLKPVDRAALGTAITRYMQEAPGLPSRVFTVRDLLSMEQVRSALEPAIGSLDDPGVGRRVGKLLARANGQVIDGLHIQHAGTDRDGVVWRAARALS